MQAAKQLKIQHIPHSIAWNSSRYTPMATCLPLLSSLALVLLLDVDGILDLPPRLGMSSETSRPRAATPPRGCFFFKLVGMSTRLTHLTGIWHWLKFTRQQAPANSDGSSPRDPGWRALPPDPEEDQLMIVLSCSDCRTTVSFTSPVWWHISVPCYFERHPTVYHSMSILASNRN